MEADIGLIGTIATSIFVTIAAIAAYARDGVVRGAKKIKDSFVALVSSPAVWLAVFLTFVGGYWFGHVHGAFGKKSLRSEISTLKASLKDAKSQADNDVEAWKKTADSTRKELGILKSKAPPKAAQQTVQVRRPVPRRIVAVKASSESAKPFWPFP